MEQTSTHSRIPNQSDYEHLGAYLRDLREHFSLDVAEVARRTHIRAKYIQAMEDGQIDLMPGKVYARGYIVTYAEFFNLNAEEFATRYMAQYSATTPPTTQAQSLYFVPEPKRVRSSQNARWARRSQLAAVMLGVGAIMYYILPQDPVSSPVTSRVAPVPDRLLAEMRTLIMPMPQNIECLTSDRWLACLDRTEITKLPSIVSPSVILPSEEASAPNEKNTTAESPSSKEVNATIDGRPAPTEISAAAEPTEPTKKDSTKLAKKPAPTTKTPPKKPETKLFAPAINPAESAQKNNVPPHTIPTAPAANVPSAGAPETTAAPDTDKAPAPEATSPEVAPKKEKESLIPSSWFDILPDATSTEEPASDPNSRR
jgi:Helix-turn-helix domain